MKPKRDYYEVLEVEKDADQRTIKRAFLKKARKLHPDVSDDPNAEALFKEVNEAYSVLSDETKRANYDRYGDASGPAGFGGSSNYVDMSDIFGGGFGGFSDIFDSFFGGRSGHGGAHTRTRGSDMAIHLSITLEEAACGTHKTIAYDRLSPCDDCNGSGVAEGGHITTCPRCKGTGAVVQVQKTVFGQMQTQAVCPECAGTGKKIDKPCETCGGEGRTPDHEHLRIDIPAGIHSGQSLVIKGKGEAGVRGDTTGDLIVTVEVSPHETFERRGDDLYMSVSIDSLQAIVGTSVMVDGIMQDERVEVKIPAGCQYGQQIMVSNHGMPQVNGISRGNLIVMVQITTPTDLTSAQLLDLAALVAQRSSDVLSDKDIKEAASEAKKKHPRPHKKSRK